ncbi:MAG: glycosyltransferase family 4 protein [Betaproteobacteria bacterium]|nr:MAG: glycosyltransferase family 4 protein [Betaproteobacteria bacterium]
MPIGSWKGSVNFPTSPNGVWRAYGWQQACCGIVGGQSAHQDPRRPRLCWSHTGGLPSSSRRTAISVLFVTPFCVFPPRHGGARRIDGLLRELRRDFEIVLVTDEAALYDARSFAYFDGLHAVHFVQRPKDVNGGSAADLGQRLRTHCHPSLVDAVEAALQRYRPELVQIEHVELASLSRLRLPSQRWILGLHDAFLTADFDDRSEGDRLQRSVMQSYDAVTVCSAEDEAMISHPRVVRVPNGSAVSTYSPSTSFQLLFLGPFRYILRSKPPCLRPVC